MRPGNKRGAGPHNPDYRTTFVFDNDYPALLPDTPTAEVNLDGLLSAVMISPQKQKFGQRGI